MDSFQMALQLDLEEQGLVENEKECKLFLILFFEMLEMEKHGSV